MPYHDQHDNNIMACDRENGVKSDSSRGRRHTLSQTVHKLKSRKNRSVEPVRSKETRNKSCFMDAGTQTDDSNSDTESKHREITISSSVKIDDHTVENSAQTSEEEFDEEETVEVNQLSSMSKYKIKVGVEGTPVEAVVDTGSDVTIISDEVFDKLKNKPKILKHVTLNAAGRKMRMTGRVVGPVKLNIGSQIYEEIVHVAPISQDMLLGFNFIQGKTVLDFVNGIFHVDGEKIVMKVDETKGEIEVARVTVSKRCVVPPNSVKHIPCRLNCEMKNFVVEAGENLEVLVPENFT